MGKKQFVASKASHASTHIVTEKKPSTSRRIRCPVIYTQSWVIYSAQADWAGQATMLLRRDAITLSLTRYMNLEVHTSRG